MRLFAMAALSMVGCDGSKDASDTGGWYDSEPSAAPGDAESDEDDDLGSEEETTLLGLRPATTPDYVFVANADRDTVTRIAVPALDVITASVGVRPSMVATSADHTLAVTFNEGSDSLSVIDAETLAVTEVEIRDNLNAMVMSTDGRWAICYHDLSEEEAPDYDGAISYNEISIVDLVTLTHHETVVGMFPHDVQFTEDSSTAVVVSDDYLAVIDLSGDTPATARIALSDDTVDPPAAEEVLLDPAGQYAFVRQYGVDNLVLVDIPGRATSPLLVGDSPTDMDLSPDGTQAIVVARGSSEVWTYDMADPTALPEVLSLPDDAIFGQLQLSPVGELGILYSTVSGESRYGLWDRSTDEITTVGLVKPISSLGISPDGASALIFHTLDNGDTDPDSVFYSHHALTLIDLSDGFANPVRLDAEPIAYDNAADGRTGFVILDGEPGLQVLHYETLIHDQLDLPSAPVYLGVLPDTNTAYVSQEHDLGRISFFEADTEELRTITGFELNAAIED
jgi:DNA-binding beta-propeller fold protein YncE